MRTLIEESNKMLEPLSDPLTAKLGLHRWLVAEREEAYSDWLAWVIEQLTVEQALRVLGILSGSIALYSHTKLRVRREVVIPKGRLDIVIRIGAETLIVVEVKKASEQAAQTEKQKGYSAWLNGKDNSLFKDKKSILLVTEVSDDYREKAGDQFSPVLWSHVCSSLRELLALPEFRRRELVTSALIIAFVGAVEQNILGFVNPDAEGGSSLRYASTADYIKQALSRPEGE